MNTHSLFSCDHTNCRQHTRIVGQLVEYLVRSGKRSAGMRCEVCDLDIHVDWKSKTLMIGDPLTLASFIDNADQVTLFDTDAIISAEVAVGDGEIEREGRFSLAAGTYRGVR